LDGFERADGDSSSVRLSAAAKGYQKAMLRPRYLYLALVLLALVGVAFVGFAWLLSPTPGPFTEADVALVKPGMTLAEVEAVFGPPIPDAESGLTPRTEEGGFWKAWKGEAYDLHVDFDATEHCQGALLHPRAPLRIQKWSRRF
jgi:hypothetical protein